MEHRNLTTRIMATAMLIMSMIACSNSDNAFIFENPEQALNVCRTELSKIKKVKKADIKQISEITSRWIALQDTTFTIMMRDTTINSSSDIAIDFFAVSDSIRKEISRLVLDEPRTIEEVMYFKVHTARNRDRIHESEDYKKAVSYYNDLNKVETFKTADESLKNYKTLLQNNNYFKTEKDLLAFISKEDRCFRSIMEHLHELQQKDLEEISSKTALIFQKLYENTQASPENAVNSRVTLYLSMRFNRRIIQNAEAVIRDLAKGYKLSEIQTANYRWMLLQPFMTIDMYSMAAITPEQEKSLIEISKNLPKYLAYIDGKDFNKSDSKEKNKLTEILTKYFLRSYLHQLL